MACTCMPGFVNMQPDDPAACEPCGVGFYCTGADHRQPCAASQTTVTGTSGTEAECICKAGNFLADGFCAPCPAGRFKESAGNLACASCAANTFINDTGRSHPCQCLPGYGYDEETALCTACPPGEYKMTVGNALCSRCSVDKSSPEGATSLLECHCRPGSIEEGNSCRECSEDFFCAGEGEEVPCPVGATSRAGSSTPADCVCGPGYYFRKAEEAEEGNCELCEPGRYKPSLANEALCALQCPTNAESPNGSTSIANCSCTAGYYAELDQADSITRCASCQPLPHLYCPGGFHLQSGLQRQPIARPGYYQTGVTTAVKCSVVSSDGLSVCLGGAVCLDDSNSSQCVGKYANACGKGSTGPLCGECLPGWARSGFQQPCQLCEAGAASTLIAASLVDVGTKVT